MELDTVNIGGGGKDKKEKRARRRSSCSETFRLVWGGVSSPIPDRRLEEAARLKWDRSRQKYETEGHWELREPKKAQPLRRNLGGSAIRNARASREGLSSEKGKS